MDRRTTIVGIRAPAILKNDAALKLLDKKFRVDLKEKY